MVHMMELPMYKYEKINTVGHIIRQGKARSSGLPVYQLVTDSEKYTTSDLEIKEAVKEDRVVFVAVYVDGKTAIQVHNKPYIARNKVYVPLHIKLNDIWETLWKEGKPVIVEFVIKARGGGPS